MTIYPAILLLRFHWQKGQLASDKSQFVSKSEIREAVALIAILNLSSPHKQANQKNKKRCFKMNLQQQQY